MNAIVSPVDFSTRILIVDDDEGIRTLIAEFLARHGYQAETADGAAAMRAAMTRQPPVLIVLDVMMPGEDGLSALRSLQSQGAPPVIMLSAVGTDIDRIIGLELGADDYLVKPCNPRELLARIRTVLRRRSAASPPPSALTGEALIFDRWRLDLLSRTVTDSAGAEIALSDGEFRLLRAFAEKPQRVLTRDQLLDATGGDASDSFDRSIDVQVSRLRRKLAGGEALIRTVRSEGYMFIATVHHRFRCAPLQKMLLIGRGPRNGWTRECLIRLMLGSSG